MDRRRFLKRVAIGSAVAAPIVSSFSMSGMNAAYAQAISVSGSNLPWLCDFLGPYGPNQYAYGPNETPLTVRPDLFGPNGQCLTLDIPNWWAF